MANDGDSRPRSSNRRVTVLLPSLSLVVMVVCLIAAIPRGAGPDEQQHVVRGAALVRGQLNGESDWPMTSYRWFRVPWWLTEPNPACYAFNPLQAADCAVMPFAPPVTEVRYLAQTASYPPTAHVLAGVGTLVAGEHWAQWVSRIFNAIVPLGLIAWVLASLLRAPRSSLMRPAVLVTLAPSTLFFISVVNPSGWTAAGALAMWTAQLGDAFIPLRRRAALWVAGACALMLARFDGVAFAAVVACFGVLWGAGGLYVEVVRRRALVLALAASATINLGWTIHYGRRSLLVGGKAVEYALLGIVLLGVVALARSPRALASAVRLSAWLRGHRWVAPVVFVVVPVVLFFVDAHRRGLPYAAAIGNTGRSIEESVGVLGWVDTRIPDSAFILCYLAIGALLGIAALAGQRQRLMLLMTLLASAVSLQWLLQTRLQYWHGRYLFPVFLGIPLMAAAVFEQRLQHDRESLTWAGRRRFGWTVGVSMWLVVTLGFAQTMRRFGVSAVGVMNPMRWDTYGALASPAVLLVVFGVAAASLVVALLGVEIRSSERQ